VFQALLGNGRIRKEGTPQPVLPALQRERTQEFPRGLTLFRLPEPAAAVPA